MPTYEYACRDCGEQLEVQQSFTDDALTVCPACGGSLRKVFGNIAISFKGAGFYKNDSRSSSKSGSGSSSSSTESTSSDTKTDSKSDTKTDSKSDTKTDSKPEKKPEKKTEKPSTPAAASSGSAA